MKQKITLQNLESFLFSLADDLRAKMDASEYKYYIIGLIFLKRLSDEFRKAKNIIKNKYKYLPKEQQNKYIEKKRSYGDMFFVPKEARWWEGYTDIHGQPHPPIKDVKTNVGERLNIAIAAIEESNDRLDGVLKNNINFNSEKGKNNERIKDSDWISLINKLTTFGSLSGENFEFPDLLGAAYEYLIKYFADSAGKKGGEFYTPAEVVRLMVQIIEPKEGDSIYDPTVGSGGMLIQSHQFVEENSQNTYRIGLNGQENDGGVWATCIMNMILHDVKDFEIKHGNTLEEPMFQDLGGKYRKFDKILANPPFSMNYKKENLTQTSRFKWGYAPESKKADLMFVEHMASSLKQDGLMAVVIPHGVLFRGSKEKEIRSAMLEDNIIDAVIGLPPALFYGTGIPAAILVIKKNRCKNEKILFINADKEYAEEKAKNRLRASDIEKISFVYHHKNETDQKYSKLISLNEIRKNDYNLNIRRYVDNSDPIEPENVKAHLRGGVPLCEIQAYATLYQKFNFDFNTLLVKKDEEYFVFIGDIDIKDKITNDKNVLNILTTYKNHLNLWWDKARVEFSKLCETKNINKTKNELLESFKDDFDDFYALDKFQTSGVFVGWWNSVRYDLKTISSIGFSESLLSDEILKEAFFQEEINNINKLETKLSNLENDLNEAVENVEYDQNEDEEITKKPQDAKVYLEDIIKELENEEKDEYKKERLGYEKQLKKIVDLQKNIKECKASKKECEYSLSIKIEAKRYGEIEQLPILLQDLKNLQNHIKDNKTKAKELKKFQKNEIILKQNISKLQNILQETLIITPDEAKELTLKKHHSLIYNELNIKIKDELNNLIKIFENFQNKYQKSLLTLENELKQSENKINEFLKTLGYLDE